MREAHRTKGSTDIRSSRSRRRSRKEGRRWKKKTECLFVFFRVEAPAPRDPPPLPAPSPSSPRQRVPSPRSPRQPQPCCTDLFPGLRRTVHMCTEHLRRAAHQPHRLPVRDDEQVRMSRPISGRAIRSVSTQPSSRDDCRSPELTASAPEEP